jgi:hypothetical protein
MELDDWLPNFDLFVMTVLPALLAVTIAVILINFWTKRSKKPSEYSWMDVLLWMTAVYFIIPFWRIIQYLLGDKSFSILVEELFIEDFYNYMVLLLIVGIVGAVYILLRKSRKWGVRS